MELVGEHFDVNETATERISHESIILDVDETATEGSSHESISMWTRPRRSELARGHFDVDETAPKDGTSWHNEVEAGWRGSDSRMAEAGWRAPRLPYVENALHYELQSVTLKKK